MAAGNELGITSAGEGARNRAAVFAVMFSVSAFIIGPAINSGTGAPPGGGTPVPSVDHSSHHG